MRIGFITGEYPPMEGGVGAYTHEMARASVELGHSVSVFTRYAEDTHNETGIVINREVGPKWGWYTNRLIREWVAEWKPDIINVQFQTAAYDMHPAIHWLPDRITDCPIVTTFHDLRVPYLFPKAGKLRENLVKRLALSSTGVITTDHADEQTLQENWNVPMLKWIPIGSNIAPAPISAYDRAAWRSRIDVSDEALLISYFGFLNETKGGHVLVEALARLIEQDMPAHLVMIGGRAGASDPTNLAYGEQVDRLVNKYRLHDYVHWTGYVDDAEVSGYFYASDVTALPYLDGVSLRRGTLMAALAHGRAIITTDPLASVPELENTIITAKPGDATALATAIQKAWHDRTLRKELEQAALRTSELFQWDNIARESVHYYQEILTVFEQ